MHIPINMPKEVELIIDTLNANGHEAFIVGGCVRDSLMGIPPKDWDITTSAMPADMKKYFSNTHDTGIKHGTITIVINKMNFETTTYRIDGEYMDNRRPDQVFFTANLNEDLMRRDFTMNAIAYHKTLGYVDPYDGITDIYNKTIRGVGNPAKRFQEDALRMLRALRFSAQLDFEIEALTYESLKDNVSLLKNISVERIHDEIVKLIMSGHTEKIRLVLESGMSEYIYPGLACYFDAHIDQIIPCLQYDEACYEKNLSRRLGLLFMFFSADATAELMKHLRFDNQTIKRTVLYVQWIHVEIPDDFYAIRKILSQTGIAPFQNILTLKTIQAGAIAFLPTETLAHLENIQEKLSLILANKDCFLIGSLRINGEGLKKLGIPNGKAIGDMLRYLLEQVMRNPEKNQKEQLKELVLTHWQELQQ